MGFSKFVSGKEKEKTTFDDIRWFSWIYEAMKLDLEFLKVDAEDRPVSKVARTVR
jgi:hypothetical protein